MFPVMSSNSQPSQISPVTTAVATDPLIQSAPVFPAPALSAPGLWLRLEGLAVLTGAVLVYAHLGLNGWLFALLLLAPDLAMIGYLQDVRFGAFTCNLAHNMVLPLALLAVSFSVGWTTGIMLALIWLAHIGMDRIAGYGLKYSTDFKRTHMQQL